MIGPRVLFLHGQPGRGSDFAVARSWVRGRSVSAIAPDRPGWGGGDGPPLGIAGNAAWASQFLAAETVVVGYSFGAAIAAAIAVEYPRLVAGLVLVAPAATQSSLLAVDYLLALDLVGRALQGSFGKAGGKSSKLGAYRRDGASFHVEQRHMVAELRGVEGRLPEIRARTSVIYGMNDRVVPPRAVCDLVNLVPQSRLILLPGHGHRLLATAPAVIGGAIAEILG